MRGVTTADLNPSGTSPSSNDWFTSLVIEGNRMSMQSLTRNVGNGSNKHDLDGEGLRERKRGRGGSYGERWERWGEVGE